MRYMLLMHPGAKAEEAGALPDPTTMAAMMKYNEELQKAGVLLALEGLQSSAKGARITKHNGKPRVVDGPFPEAKELIGGYWLLQVKSKEEAVEWAKRCPLADDEMLELRLVFEMSDFTNIDPALAARVDEIGKKLSSR